MANYVILSNASEWISMLHRDIVLSVLVYVHRDCVDFRDGDPRTSTSTVTQLLSSDTKILLHLLNAQLSVRRYWRGPRSRMWVKGRLYLTLHCHHQNDSCIKMGSEWSHFKVALRSRDKVTKQCPQTRTFEERGEPKRNRTEVTWSCMQIMYTKSTKILRSYIHLGGQINKLDQAGGGEIE